MRIEIADLEVGDEILVPSGGKFKYLKLLKKPEVSPKGPGWAGKPRYRSVRCLQRAQVNYHVYKHCNYAITTYETDNLNQRVSVNLTYKEIWLVKREEL